MDEIQILKEVGGIASGHGGIALSEILGRKISLEVPSVQLINSNDIPKNMNIEKIGVAVLTKIILGLKGDVAVILDEKTAFKLVDLSYKIDDDDKRSGIFTEMTLSLIKEVGNVIIGSYLNALSLMLKRMIIPPIPTLISGSIGEILSIIFSSDSEESSYLIEAVFEEAKSGIKGVFYLILTPGAAKDISETCSKMLDNNGN